MYDENEVMETEVDESVEEEVADLEENEETEVTEETGEKEEQEVAEPTQTKEQNAQFANMRRRAEAEAQRKFDKRIADMCSGVVHPITGKPITTLDEYQDALNAQNRIQAERELNEKGIDISVLDEYVNSSPVLAQARQIVEQYANVQVEAQLKEDFEALKAINPDLKTYDDIENIQDVVLKVSQGYSLVDAYKIVNFDVLMTKGTKSAKQSAINQARGKSHLEPTENISSSDESDISETELMALRENFPDKSDKEIRRLYKQTFKK